MKQVHWKRMKTQNLNSMENPSRVVMVYVVSPALVTTATTDMIRKMVCQEPMSNTDPQCYHDMCIDRRKDCKHTFASSREGPLMPSQQLPAVSFDLQKDVDQCE
jgi:hypothetical protein